jgi:hypothetical protein
MARQEPLVPHAWVSLTPEEGQQLLDALREWESHRGDSVPSDGWHTHITDGDGNELTIGIE